MKKLSPERMPVRVPLAKGECGGAYLLCLEVPCRLVLEAGSLGRITLAPGRYAYVGGARRSIAGRVARHCRLACGKSGRRHWHIDHLLAHAAVRLAAVIVYERVAECALSRRLACRRGVSVAVPSFGASDCRSGCRTHLYRLETKWGFFRLPLARGRPNVV